MTSKSNNLELLKLVTRHCDITIKDCKGKTALDIAIERKYSDFIEYLKTYMGSNVEKWTEDEVYGWLTKTVGINKNIGKLFMENMVNGKVLVQITETDITELKISKLIAKRIISEVDEITN